MSCLATQIRLLSTLDAYLSAEGANQIAPGHRAQEQKADQLHAALTHLCIACGFTPGRDHRGISVVEFAIHRATVLRRVFPNNLKEAGL